MKNAVLKTIKDNAGTNETFMNSMFAESESVANKVAKDLNDEFKDNQDITEFSSTVSARTDFNDNDSNYKWVIDTEFTTTPKMVL